MVPDMFLAACMARQALLATLIALLTAGLAPKPWPLLAVGIGTGNQVHFTLLEVQAGMFFNQGGLCLALGANQRFFQGCYLWGFTHGIKQQPQKVRYVGAEKKTTVMWKKDNYLDTYP